MCGGWRVYVIWAVVDTWFACNSVDRIFYEKVNEKKGHFRKQFIGEIMDNLPVE
jgi:hypothetical protein